MITVTGRTFDHRELFKSWRGEFDKQSKSWSFRRLDNLQKVKLRSLVGVFVSETDADTAHRPTTDDAISDAMAAIDAAFGSSRPVYNPDSAALADVPERRYFKRTPATYGDDDTYLNHFADQNPLAFFGFSTLDKFTDYIASLTPNDTPGWSIGDADFAGTSNMREAIQIARDGWKEGVETALELMEKLSVDNPRVKRRNTALAGGSVNVGRLLSGDPAHMVKRTKQPGRKVVTFFVEAGCNGYISTDSMTLRAAMIAAMVDLMENAGYSCAVVAVDTSLRGDDPTYQLVVRLKDSGERLNLADIVFALGHPAFLRRFSFAATASVPETHLIHKNMGSASNSFDERYRCRPSEFYVPVLTKNVVASDPFAMLEHVTPAKLPITIKV